MCYLVSVVRNLHRNLNGPGNYKVPAAAEFCRRVSYVDFLKLYSLHARSPTRCPETVSAHCTRHATILYCISVRRQLLPHSPRLPPPPPPPPSSILQCHVLSQDLHASETHLVERGRPNLYSENITLYMLRESNHDQINFPDFHNNTMHSFLTDFVERRLTQIDGSTDFAESYVLRCMLRCTVHIV